MYISHDAPYLPPPPEFCITFQVVFDFSWILQPSQDKLRIIVMQNLGGQRRRIMGVAEVAYIGVVLFFIGLDFVSVNTMLDISS